MTLKTLLSGVKNGWYDSMRASVHLVNKKYLCEYELNNTKLQYVDHEKDIGVVIDDKLSFDKHISEKCKKANSMFTLKLPTLS